MNSPVWQRIPSHLGDVGGLTIRRALPTAARRTIGAWCFLDHAGPAQLAPEAGMRVGPHPHTGLQTFSWLIEGQVLHRDSLGSEQLLRPGEVNLMTAGRGIAHSEESQSARLHLAQLWIALPEAQRFCAPAFEHFATLPRLPLGGFGATLLVGELLGQRSPVPSHSPLLGVDLHCLAPAEATLALRPDFEYGVMVLEGDVRVDQHEPLGIGELLYLAPGADAMQLRASAGCRLLLLGGAPFDEPLLLWWNFVGREPEEIRQFAADWNAEATLFGAVQGFDGPRLKAPPVPALRKPA
ncbi:pirin family protein [Paucibacter sp. APW11]|uniref:Pirin family protein n=1 Tax=Roseateles aquae TaxID=3077235 RepID=A0ABU3PEP3_9BURK|nr:pirin family protein [Paucibacter sp. APW11]MDT9000762.1 pirin family protein [Paucibacter sp. APW11]